MRLGMWLLAVVTVLSSACATAPRHPAWQGQARAPLIPARTFFANRDDVGGFQVSPDGQKIGWIATHGTGPALWVRALAAGAVDHVAALGVGSFTWAQDSQHVLIQADLRGNEDFHVFALDTANAAAAARDLTPYAGTRALLHAQLPDDPVHVLVQHNQRDKQLFDLYRINILTGAQTLVARNPGNALGYVTDAAGEVVGMIHKEGTERVLRSKPAGAEAARDVMRWNEDDTVTVLAPDAQGQGFMALSNRGRDKLALVQVDAHSGQERVLHADPDVDLAQVLLSPRMRTPIAALSAPDYPDGRCWIPNGSAIWRCSFPKCRAGGSC